jgi:hypothetical protein|tara:strand:+ start:5168 stop:5527 length:360 start_codon:yes stop_codon:yes gene_type:complete
LNKVTVGKVNAVVVYIAWFCLASIVVLMAVTYFNAEVGLPLFMGGVFVLILLAIIHGILAYFVRCPHCKKCLTVQGFQKPHPNSRVSGKKDAWVVVITQWFSGSVVCIHCGAEVDTNAL